MTDRERWIIYPLLFLSLGISLRDSVSNSSTDKVIDARLIRCQAIHVGEIEAGQKRVGIKPGTVTSFDSEGQPLAQFGRDLRCQRVVVNDTAGVAQVGIGSITRPTADGPRSSGVITVHGENGLEIISLRARHQIKVKATPLSNDDQPGKIVLEVADISEDGGQVLVYDSARATSVMLAHGPNQLGLYVARAGQISRPLAAIRKRASPGGAKPTPDASGDGAAVDKSSGENAAAAQAPGSEP